jgi:hypothetical protein
MSKAVRVDPAAEEEIAAGVAWYDAQRPGLPDRLRAASCGG